MTNKSIYFRLLPAAALLAITALAGCGSDPAPVSTTTTTSETSATPPPPPAPVSSSTTTTTSQTSP
jgi:ABC-type glycerol-3-phosphate transport system substrate-binding protein